MKARSRRGPSRRAGSGPGMSSASKVIAVARSRAVAPGRHTPAVGCAVVGGLGGLVEAVHDQRSDPPPVRGRRRGRRPASQRLPRRTTAATRDAATASPNVAPTRVQKTESNPTLWNHSASVHRSRPTLNSRKTARTKMTSARARAAGRSARLGPGRRHRGRPAGRRGGSPPPPLGRRATGGDRRYRSSVARRRRRASSSGRGPHRRRRRVEVVAVGVVVGRVGPGRRRVRRAPGAGSSPRAAASRFGVPPGNRRRGRASESSLAGLLAQGRSEALDRPDGTRPGRSRRARSGASPRPAPARSGRRPGARVGRATDGPGRRAGRPADPQLEPAVVLEDQAGERAGEGRPEARRAADRVAARRPGPRRGS